MHNYNITQMLNGRPALRELLFTLVAPGESHCDIPALQPEEWQALLKMTNQHRLGPLLHQRAKCSAELTMAPAWFLSSIAHSYRKHAVRSLQFRSQLVAIHRLLRTAGIPTMYLKGAYLAFHTYPDAALRPLRDLDILVSRNDAMRSFETLLRAGFVRDPQYRGNPLAAIECAKHLPPLTAPHSGVCVEIHTRLFEPNPQEACAPGIIGEMTSLQKRGIEQRMLGEDVCYPGATDQLLHLCVHAVYDHRLDNGPLVLHDVATLLKSLPIDWSLFWNMAEVGRWQPGCWLILHAVKHFDPTVTFSEPPGYAAPTLPSEFLDVLATLMLCDLDRRGEIRLRVDLTRTATLRERVRLILSRICPDRVQVAAMGAAGEGISGAKASYLAHWWRLATVRLPKILLAAGDTGAAHEARAAKRLQRWLVS